MLDSIFTGHLKCLNILFLCLKVQILLYYTQPHNRRDYVTLLIFKPAAVCQFYSMALYQSHRRRHVIKVN